MLIQPPNFIKTPVSTTCITNTSNEKKLAASRPQSSLSSTSATIEQPSIYLPDDIFDLTDRDNVDPLELPLPLPQIPVGGPSQSPSPSHSPPRTLAPTTPPPSSSSTAVEEVCQQSPSSAKKQLSEKELSFFQFVWHFAVLATKVRKTLAFPDSMQYPIDVHRSSLG